MDAQGDHLIQMVLLSTQNRCVVVGVKIEIDGWDHSFSSLPSWRAVFLFTMEKKCHGCSRGPSPWRRYF